MKGFIDEVMCYPSAVPSDTEFPMHIPQYRDWWEEREGALREQMRINKEAEEEEAAKAAAPATPPTVPSPSPKKSPEAPQGSPERENPPGYTPNEDGPRGNPSDWASRKDEQVSVLLSINWVPRKQAKASNLLGFKA